MANSKGHAEKYGRPHRKLRERVAQAVEAGGMVCARCGRPILPGSAWDLGHDDQGRWHGAEHRRCNRAAGAKRRNELYKVVRRDAAAAPAARRGFASPFGADDPDPDNQVVRWSRHWGGSFNPRCPGCRERGEACDAARRNAAA
jgi:putative intracellular protease/amidase